MNKIAIYSTHAFEKPFLVAANAGDFDLQFINDSLHIDTVAKAAGCIGVAVFTSDEVSGDVLKMLKEQGIHFVSTRSTGYDHIDLQQASALGIRVANVPAYSPNAIAEHAVMLMLALNRHIIRSNEQVSRFDFSVENLSGFNMQGATVGVVGTGNIGTAVCRILLGFGCTVLASDIVENSLLIEAGVRYVSFPELCAQSGIITLHAPLLPATTYMVNSESISWMKTGVMLINTSRGKLVNTLELLAALDSGKVGSFGADVYEKEKGIFFNDMSAQPPADDLLKRLVKHPNVLLTSHHAFLTKEALQNIAQISLQNIRQLAGNEACANELKQKG